jgi:hypothetical protein
LPNGFTPLQQRLEVGVFGRRQIADEIVDDVVAPGDGTEDPEGKTAGRISIAPS